MDKPNFNTIGKHKILNKQSFDQWRNDYPATKQFKAPKFHEITLDDGAKIYDIITEKEFDQWLQDTAPSQPEASKPVTQPASPTSEDAAPPAGTEINMNPGEAAPPEGSPQ